MEMCLMERLAMNNYYSKIAFCIMIISRAFTAFGCQITLLNDTDQAIFAIDEDVSEGTMLNGTEQADFGSMHRRPQVVVYIQILPEGVFTKSYLVSQDACALQDSDKLITLSAIIKGQYNRDIFSVT